VDTVYIRNTKKLQVRDRDGYCSRNVTCYVIAVKSAMNYISATSCVLILGS